VQQTGGIQRKMTVSQPNDPHEVEADQMAQAVMKQEQSGELDRQIVARAEEEKDKDKHLAVKADASALMRQPEALKPEEEEDKKKVHAKLDGRTLARQEDDGMPN
jgi:hypothetical protein